MGVHFVSWYCLRENVFLMLTKMLRTVFLKCILVLLTGVSSFFCIMITHSFTSKLSQNEAGTKGAPWSPALIQFLPAFYPSLASIWGQTVSWRWWIWNDSRLNLLLYVAPVHPTLCFVQRLLTQTKMLVLWRVVICCRPYKENHLCIKKTKLFSDIFQQNMVHVLPWGS